MLLVGQIVPGHRAALSKAQSSGSPDITPGQNSRDVMLKADRANASQAGIEQHDDRRTEREKMEQRREFLDESSHSMT